MSRSAAMIYRDPVYAFTMVFPAWWRKYCVISKVENDSEAEAAIHFKFVYRGKMYGPIFSLWIYAMNRKEWIEQGYEDSPLAFLTEHAGRIWAYSIPEELPYAFVNPDTGDYDYKKYGKPIQLLKRMVNHDVPIITRSLQFIQPSSVCYMRSGLRQAVKKRRARKVRKQKR